MIGVLLSICTGLSLSAACGFRVFAPFFALSVGVRFFDLPIPVGLDWIASWPSLICFSVAMLAEVAVYYIPWIDNALDLISTPLALVGGALMMVGVLGDMPPYMRWSVAVIVGSGAAGAVQIGTALTRAFSTAATGGAGNGVVTTGENVSAVGVTLMSVLLPVVAALLVLGLAGVLVWLCRKCNKFSRKS